MRVSWDVKYGDTRKSFITTAIIFSKLKSFELKIPQLKISQLKIFELEISQIEIFEFKIFELKIFELVNLISTTIPLINWEYYLLPLKF